jgi:hypothetical protein
MWPQIVFYDWQCCLRLSQLNRWKRRVQHHHFERVLQALLSHAVGPRLEVSAAFQMLGEVQMVLSFEIM